MKGIVLFGMLAFIAGACWRDYIKSDDDQSKKSPIPKIKEKLSKSDVNADNLIEVDIFTMKFMVSRTKLLFTNPDVVKVACIDSNVVVNNIEMPQSFLEIIDSGINYIIVSVDKAGNVKDVECIKANTVDADVIQKLGNEGMIVINR